jgi:biopolymer transport protein ExbB/TolQ
MSPASYLTAPPRVAAASLPKAVVTIAAVPWWTWVSLGVFLAVSVSAAFAAAALAFRTFRAVRRVQAQLLAAVERLAEDADALAVRVEQAGARVEEAERLFAAVQRSAERLGVLKWALGESLDAVSRLRHAVPHK